MPPTARPTPTNAPPHTLILTPTTDACAADADSDPNADEYTVPDGDPDAAHAHADGNADGSAV